KAHDHSQPEGWPFVLRSLSIENCPDDARDGGKTQVKPQLRPCPRRISTAVGRHEPLTDVKELRIARAHGPIDRLSIVAQHVSRSRNREEPVPRRDLKHEVHAEKSEQNSLPVRPDRHWRRRGWWRGRMRREFCEREGFLSRCGCRCLHG